MPKLIQEQQQTAFDALKGEFGWTNHMQTPKLQKVVISVGVGKMAKDKNKVELVADRLAKITGQKPAERGAKKSIATYKTRIGDKVLLVWILCTLLLGLVTILESAQHRDGGEMVLLMTWAQHVMTFRGDAASFMEGASPIFKLHMFMGMTLFVIFPFTRLVHAWSGFASVTYLGRPWQLVRRR